MLGKYQKKSVKRNKSNPKKTRVKSMKKVKPRVKSVSKAKPKVKSVSKSDSGCVEQFTKKYQERPSPAYPANKCCGESKRGKDGMMYESRADKNGVCTWKKVKNHSGVRKRHQEPFNAERFIAKYNHEIAEIERKLVHQETRYLRGRLAHLRKQVTRLLDRAADDMPLEPLRLVRQ
jgi:hypothetical protein